MSSVFPSFPARGSIAKPGSAHTATATTATSSTAMKSPRAAAPVHGFGKVASRSRPQENVKAVEEEYIKNLQQQIYLLELETRFLRQNKNQQPQQPSSNTDLTHPNYTHGQTSSEAGSASASPLNDAIRNLKYKYVELQDKNNEQLKKLQNKIDDLTKESSLQKITILNLEKDNEEAKAEVKSIQDKSNAELEQSQSDNISLAKRLEIAQAEIARLEMSYNRTFQDKERLQTELSTTALELAKSKDQTKEQLQINANLQKKVEELQKSNAEFHIKIEDQQTIINNFDIETYKNKIRELEQDKINMQTEIKQLETLRAQQDQLYKRVQEDCNELTKKNVVMLNELENLRKSELEHQQEKIKRRQEELKNSDNVNHELLSLRDAAVASKIAIEAKDLQITELHQQLQTQEINLNKVLEAKAVLEDKIITIEDRLKKQENEIVQLNQEKTVLTSDVTQLRHSDENKTRRLQEMMKTTSNLQVELERSERERLARKQFGQLVHQIEQSGENYLHLMKSVRSYLTKGPDGTVDIETELDGPSSRPGTSMSRRED